MSEIFYYYLILLKIINTDINFVKIRSMYMTTWVIFILPPPPQCSPNTLWTQKDEVISNLSLSSISLCLYVFCLLR